MGKFLLTSVLFIALTSSYTLFAQDDFDFDFDDDETTVETDDETSGTDETSSYDYDTDEETSYETEEETSYETEETKSSKHWGDSYGSCYGKGNKNISIGMCLGYLGFYYAFDYGFHDCISGGIASAYTGHSTRYWRFHYIPIAVRAAFHPFNLSVLANKIKVRNKLDVFAGISTGWKIEWVNWKGTGAKPEKDVGGFLFREYLGIRFFPTDFFYISAEEGCGLGIFNIGVGFKF